MFDFNRFQSNAASAIAAFLFAAVSVGAAVGPAQAGNVAPVQVASVAASVNADV